MASVADMKFVDESENFDFKKSGKSSRPRRENWSMLYIAESDEGDVESTESRDASSFEEDVEILSFENGSEESASASASSGESLACVSPVLDPLSCYATPRREGSRIICLRMLALNQS